MEENIYDYTSPMSGIDDGFMALKDRIKFFEDISESFSKKIVINPPEDIMDKEFEKNLEEDITSNEYEFSSTDVDFQMDEGVGSPIASVNGNLPDIEEIHQYQIEKKEAFEIDNENIKSKKTEIPLDIDTEFSNISVVSEDGEQSMSEYKTSTHPIVDENSIMQDKNAGKEYDIEKNHDLINEINKILMEKDIELETELEKDRAQPAWKENIDQMIDSELKKAQQSLPSAEDLYREMKDLKEKFHSMQDKYCVKGPVYKTDPNNIYVMGGNSIEMTPLFSESHLEKVHRPVFRTPGVKLAGKPTLIVRNTVLSEKGAIFYVEATQGKHRWLVRKPVPGWLSKSIPISSTMLSAYIYAIPDHELVEFLVTDVTNIIYYRSSYVVYKGQRAMLRFMGMAFGIFISEKFVDVVPKHCPKKSGNCSFTIGEYAFNCTSETERDRWIEDIENDIFLAS